LNLSHNQIVKMENMESLLSLNELNLKSNLIVLIEGMQKLGKI
jgi:Leucine-rich repeat (LRR) protein